MRKNAKNASRGTARSALLFSLTVALTLLLYSDSALLRRGASLINAFPTALAREIRRPDAPESSATLRKIGERRAIIFSPDFAASGNRLFYTGLGFQYLESASWRKVLKEINQYNRAHPKQTIREVFVEAHGSNGNGLKLQQSKERSAPRSYISLGALQEHLGKAGVERAILSACNTGRLYRPEIYSRLNMKVKDPTVLPATLGVINASKKFDPSSSSVELVRRTDSRLEATSEGKYHELPASVRRALELPASSEPFTVSNMFMQMIARDEELQLTSTGYAVSKSDIVESDLVNESIFQNFLKYLDGVVGEGI